MPGTRQYLSAGKITGRFLYQYALNLETPSYDQNDMGYDPVNNKFINSVMSIDLKIRHYWVLAPYYSIYRLQSDGSQLSFMWKNAIGTSDNQIARSYFDNLHTTLLSPASNSLSIRLLYFLDALYLKRKKNPG